MVDTLVLDNYDLAIEIYNTWWEVILESIKQLASLEWLKQIAEVLWESIMELFTWNAYEKWQSFAELWLVATWVWLTAVVWKKAIKLWSREIARLRVVKENIVSSPEVKAVVSDVSSKLDSILPKKQVDFEKKLKENVNVERQVKWLEKLWIPEELSRDMLESWLLNEGFFWGDLLRRFEVLNKKWVDYNKLVNEAIKDIPWLTKEEALLIFSYTDEIIYRKLNSYMRKNKELLSNIK